jgi:hypothetical protein
MRIAARNTPATVSIAPDTAHPIRVRTSVATFGMEADEAIALATQLADAVQELREGKTNE